jgi:uncharacterized protein YcbK (DUF882 family)
MRIATIAAGVILATVAAASSAWADVTHVVQRGHTLEAIARRYHVSVEAIVEANHLKDGRHLKPGQELLIPGVDGPRKGKERPQEGRSESNVTAPRTTASLEKSLEPRGRRVTGIVHAIRAGEEFRIRILDSRGHISDTALREFTRLSRQGSATHPPDPRLLALVGIVSDHFGGKTLEVVSGFRAYTPTQYTPHSNHNYGKALDFRIQGVTNEVLRDFCRTLRNAGCGYYPNSTFVHLDVRDTKAYWVDWSHPGEAPQYEKSGVLADEGASDVPDEKAAPAEALPRESAIPEGSPTPAPSKPSIDSVKSP